MGVYIKGVKMPTMPKTLEQGEAVPYIDVRIFADGNAVMSKGEKPYYTEYSAVSVPPHGDLIDRNKLYKQTAEWEASALRMVVKTEDEKEREKWMTVLIERGAFKHDVADAPTVIEAESEGES